MVRRRMDLMVAWEALEVKEHWSTGLTVCSVGAKARLAANQATAAPYLYHQFSFSWNSCIHWMIVPRILSS
jgi:hypothetical protein